MKALLDNVRYIEPEELREEIGSFLKLSDDEMSLLEIEIPESVVNPTPEDIAKALAKRAAIQDKLAVVVPEVKKEEEFDNGRTDIDEDALSLHCYIRRDTNASGKPVFEVQV